MNRRDAILRTAMLFGGTFVGSEVFLSCKQASEHHENLEFDRTTLGLLDEIGETIIPTTSSSPGAKSTKIGEFMRAIVSDCYSEDERKLFFDGLEQLKKGTVGTYTKGFMEMTPEEKTAYLQSVNEQAAKSSKEQKGKSPHYFTMIKQLTVWGYFSSEAGAVQALRYVEVPGRFDGCTEYRKGERGWAL